MITFEHTASSGFLNNSGANNFSYAQPAGTDRLLIIAVYSAADNVTGVTFNGVSATFINKRLMTGAAAGQYIHLYYLLAPAVTTANIVVTTSSAFGGFITGASYAGIKQSAQPDASNTNGTTSATSLTTSVTTVADNAWIMGLAYHNGTVVAGTNTTLRGGPNAVLQFFDTNAAQTPAGSYSVQTTRSPADFIGHVIASFAPSSNTFDQAITATSSVSAALETPKTIVQAITASPAVSASIANINNFARELSATATAAASVLKGLAMEISATASITATTAAERVYLVSMEAISNIVATTETAIGKVLEATASVSAEITKTFSVSQLMEATATISSTLEAGREKILEASAAITASITTAIGKTLVADVSIIAKLFAPFYKTKYPSHGDGDEYGVKYPHDTI